MNFIEVAKRNQLGPEVRGEWKKKVRGEGGESESFTQEKALSHC